MFQRILSLVLSVGLLTACGKKNKNEVSTNPNDFVRFKVNGVLVETSAWNASYGKIVGNMFTCNITSNMHQNEKTININVNATQAGEYDLLLTGATNSPNKAYGIYYPKYSNTFDTYSFKNGKFTITEIDTVQKVYAGKFYGTVVNNSGVEFQITDGEFRSTNLKRF
jgi:predicted GNAT superfamily acetyltransferase